MLMRNLRAGGGGGQREATAWPGGGAVPPFGGAFVLKDAPAVAAGFEPVQCPVRGDGTAAGCAPQRCAGGAPRAGWSRRWVFRSPGLRGRRGGGRDLRRTCAIYICKE